MSDRSQSKSPKARRSNGLTAVFIRQKKAPGRYGDDNGLYLVVDPSRAARWVLRIMCNGKRRDIGLGGAASVSLLEARDKAHELRKLRQAGRRPSGGSASAPGGRPNVRAVCADCAQKSKIDVAQR